MVVWVEKLFITNQILEMVAVDLEGENENILVPILNGYKSPYDYAINDEIGTEHYIYYEELDI